MQDSKRHDRLRAKFTPAFIGKDVLEGAEAIVDDHLTTLLELIEQKYITTPDSYSPMDLTKVITYLTTENTSCMVLGQDFECVKRDDGFHGYNHSIESCLHVLSSLIVLPAFQKFMDTPWLRSIDLMRPALRPILDIAESSAAKRFGEKRIEKKDMLAVKATILYIISSPTVYRKLQQEIDESLASGRVTTSPISSSQTRELPYLQAVIKESLRSFPPAVILPAASGQGEVVCGKLVPAGTNVEPSLKTAARDKGVYGDDADSFRPERWIEADGEKLRAMEETSRLIWGGPGRWECLGKKIALIELDKVFFEVSLALVEFDLLLKILTNLYLKPSCSDDSTWL
ncbi:Cytochrome P450 monooxygenase lolP1 [Apiospora phragmitis]|uniref:Cytochrome P450 monooxygenase lolP1 n=1 Tax=Apiospora phragmitis TaxID=2905665 RepID=A0ABR1SVA2_9PEZI